VTLRQATGVICQGQAPFVLAPDARALFAAVCDDRVPSSGRSRPGAAGSRTWKENRLVCLKRRPAVEAEAGEPSTVNWDGKNMPLLPREIRRARGGRHRPTSRERSWRKTRGPLGVAFVPEADRVLRLFDMSLLHSDDPKPTTTPRLAVIGRTSRPRSRHVRPERRATGPVRRNGPSISTAGRASRVRYKAVPPAGPLALCGHSADRAVQSRVYSRHVHGSKNACIAG